MSDKKPSEPTIKVRLLRATWSGEQRQDIGTVVELPIIAALWAVKDGLVEPADPNPFEAK